MALEVWWIGKNKQNSDIQDYLKRLGRYSQVQMVQWKDSKKKDRAARIKEESTALLQKIKRDDYLVLLDEKGKNLTSIEWSNQLNDSWLRKKRTILLIGGAYGVSDEIKSRANQKIALSKLTFPHELARLILIEQIYRAFTILNKENYHHI